LKKGAIRANCYTEKDSCEKGAAKRGERNNNNIKQLIGN
jgi:hypothetical protein